MCPPMQPKPARPSYSNFDVPSTDEVIKTLNGATTLMLCDIHLSLGGPRGVLQLLGKSGLYATVNYLYLPRGYARKSRRRCNGSLSAFVNFTSAAAAVHACRVFHGMMIQDRRVYVCRAAAQGVAANLMHFRTVRLGEDMLETAWPWVTRKGTLRETAPTEVPRLLGIEDEVAELKAQANAAPSEASTGTPTSSAHSTDTAPDAALPQLTGLAFPLDFAAMQDQMPIPDVENFVAAHAALLSVIANGSPAPQNDWWTGKLDWTQQPAWPQPAMC